MASLAPYAAAAVALTVLATCCVAARLFVRLAFVKNVGVDDCLIFLALAASIALTVVTAKTNFNTTPDDASEEESSYGAQVSELWSSNLTYNLAVLLLKDSLLLQYLRFSIDVGYRRACWALAGIITAYGVSALLVGIFSCSPIPAAWNSSISNARCIDLLAFWLFNASFNSATDIIICVLPIPVLKALSLSRKQTIVLILLFLLGAFICAASIIRLSAVYTSTVNNAAGQTISLWSTIEVNSGIICACLPSLRHPVTQFTPRFLAGRQKPRQDSVRSHTSVHFMVKNSKSIFHSPDVTRPSLSTSNTSTSHTSSNNGNNNLLEVPSSSLNDQVVGQPSPDLSITSSTTDPSSTPTSFLFDIESQQPVDAITRLPSIRQIPNTVDDDDDEKPLPTLPTLPAPAARPSGPRPLPLPFIGSQVFAMRSHKVRYEPRTVLPLACIPESSTSAGGSGSSNSGSNGASSSSSPFHRSNIITKTLCGKKGTCGNHSHSHNQDHDHESHDRTFKTINTSPSKTSTKTPSSSSPSKSPFQSPSPSKPRLSSSSSIISTSLSLTSFSSSPTPTPAPTFNSAAMTDVTNNRNTLYGNIAPWDACPCPGSKTYSYEIVGGPRALQDSATRDMSTRERMRREKERARRAARRVQEQKENDERSRPMGPRGMG
ncbi:hypothetical protein B0A52_01799 [Exophiala mesophila]|uniref:Rhodopsin domain-containing protein n=1 Tax=Exophiala mesophila TaxID=212818 RepID=A0A438NG18_EXOME|nr:hypothetical protein B0A52_01799 [Exophiala mesophila]